MPKKFTHWEDGSESILKVKHYEYDKVTFDKKEIKKDFVTLFVSVANGCKMGCKLCQLTYVDQSNYKLLTPNDIISNNYNICKNLKYDKIKISYMGMGEGIFLYKHLQNIAEDIAENKLFGVDVGTMLPFISDDLSRYLNNLLNGRLFFSLHSAVQYTRNKLINSKVSLREAKSFLKNIEIKKICHYTLIKDLNDSDEEISGAIEFCKDTNSQLRILEFNKPNNFNGFAPTTRLKEIVNQLNNSNLDYKLCYSSGKSIKAACGMFF